MLPAPDNYPVVASENATEQLEPDRSLLNDRLPLCFIRRVAAATIAVLLAGSSLTAQQAGCKAPERIMDWTADLARLDELTGAAVPDLKAVQRLSRVLANSSCIGSGAGNVGVQLLPYRIGTNFNSAYPVDRNNGVLWAGKGLSAEVAGGVYARFGPLTAGLMPTIVLEQNADFPILPFDTGAVSRFRQPWVRAIDTPQRFGSGTRTAIDPGQSFIRIDFSGFGAGLSTENIWWGPMRITPLMFSNTAGGFPHFFVGTNRPVDIWIGRLDVELFWGELAESGFFDRNEANNHRLIGGAVAAIEPRILPGLTLGVTRVEHVTGGFSGRGISEILREPYADVRSNAADNGLISGFVRLVLPESGFEAFAELARDDHWENVNDLIREPDHSLVYALGAQQVIRNASGRTWRIYGEAAQLGSATPLRGGRGVISFYSNGTIPQGHTNSGQLLGAWIGPGSNFQTLGLDRIDNGRALGVFVERLRHSSDAYHLNFADQLGPDQHDLELTVGAQQRSFRGPFEWNWRAGLSGRWNRDFAAHAEIDGRAARELNFWFSTGLLWRP